MLSCRWIVQIDRSRGYPILKFSDRQSYAGNKTKEYDDLAMKYLSYFLYPLVAGFAIYSLMYERHKSWYSWVLGSLTSCVYTFGKFLATFSLHLVFFQGVLDLVYVLSRPRLSSPSCFEDCSRTVIVY